MPVERLSERIAQDLRNKIAAGEISGKLPSAIELAKNYGVSKPTIREAQGLLASKGMLSIRQGAGTFVLGTFGTQQTNFESVLEPQEVAEIVLGQERLSSTQLFGLGLYLFTQRRVAQIAYEEHPNQVTLHNLLTTAGKERVFSRLVSQVGETAEGIDATGIKELFAPEISALQEAPTVGEALLAIKP